MKKKTLFLSIVLIIVILVSGCSLSGKIPKADLSKSKALVSEMADSVTLNEVREVLADTGLANTDEFYSWVKDFVHVAGKEANLTREWVSPIDVYSDVYACMDGWESQYDYSDADCRMTAFLLLDGVIKSKKTDKNYDGTYLAFDLDAIDNVEKYEIIKKKRDLFTTLFGEHSIREKEKAKEVFPRVWQEYGFDIKNEKVSLITVVIKDPEGVVFVGHTGVMIELEEGDFKYMFVEKLAFEQPYRATKFNDINELLELFSVRTDYFEDATLQGTFVYKNDQLIFG